jgi:lysophospholipase L1-like esterase
MGCGGNSGESEVTNSFIETDISQKSFTKLSKIQDLIQKSKDGVVDNVTYLCVGDSTRVKSNRDKAHLLFADINNTLSTYGVTSYLLARGGHELKEFIEESSYPTLSDVVKLIPSNGESTIVEFSLGLNDLFHMNVTKRDQIDLATDTIKSRLVESINLIKSQKPETTILLVSPNMLKDWSQGTKICLDAYKEVSEELDLEFINFVDNIMPKYGDENLKNWFLDGVHFSEYGLHQVSSYILSRILPK